MSDTLTQLDPVIAYDQRPGRFSLAGQQKPAAIIAQIEKVTELWREYDACVDEHLTFNTERTQLNMHAALKAANAAAVELDRMQSDAVLVEYVDDGELFSLVHPGELM